MTKDRGRGVFANCRIKKGEIIEINPVLVLTKKEAKQIDPLPLGSHLYQWGPDGKQSALVLGHACLYNHSYDPNAEQYHREKRQEVVFKAVKDINPGDEITFNYGGLGFTDPIRFTKHGWYFEERGRHK